MLLFFFPEGQVLFEELNDGLGISEGLFVNIIDLLESIRKCGFSEFAGLLVVVHDLVVEDREVESKSESNWVAGVERFRGLLGKLIVLKSAVLDGLKLISLSALSNISIVVSNHLVEESLGLIGGSLWVALSLNDFYDIHALGVKLAFDLLFVGGESLRILGVFWVLLDGADGSNGSSIGSNEVLESNGQKVSLLSGEVVSFGCNNLLKETNHVVELFSLLGDSSHENMLFQTHFSDDL